MPELADVEIFKEYFQATALHQEIDGVEVKSADVLEGISKKRLIEKRSTKSFCGVTALQRITASLLLLSVRVATFRPQK